jgi:hypothetical protein
MSQNVQCFILFHRVLFFLPAYFEVVVDAFIVVESSLPFQRVFFDIAS